MIAFLLSPLGKVALVLVLLTGWTLYQRDQAADRAREECQAEQLRRTIAEIERQRDAARDALAEAERQAAVTDKEMTDLEAARDDVLKQLASKGVAACRIPDDIRKRLLNIR